jgi:hypothetical protein
MAERRHPLWVGRVIGGLCHADHLAFTVAQKGSVPALMKIKIIGWRL